MKYYTLKNSEHYGYGMFSNTIVTCTPARRNLSRTVGITFAKYSDDKAARHITERMYNCISTVGWFTDVSDLKEINIE
jgi:hypothetical protein